MVSRDWITADVYTAKYGGCRKTSGQIKYSVSRKKDTKMFLYYLL